MNFNAVCRTCLTTEELNPIFVESVDLNQYATTIFVTTGIKVAIDDGLPQQMCVRCISFSNATLEFRKQCKDAETRLLQVKNECDSAAETFNSGDVDSEDLNDKDMWPQLKHEEGSEIDDGDKTIKSEADSDFEDNGSDLLNTMEEDPLELKPAGGEGPRCSMSYPQELQLRSCYVRLERFPIEHLHDNLHTCGTCLMTFDCESSLSSHSCPNPVQESNYKNVCDETLKQYFKFNVCVKQYADKKHIIRYLTHNEKQGGEQLLQYSPSDAKVANTERISYSGNGSYTKPTKQYAVTIQSGEPGPHPYNVSLKLHRKDIDNRTDKYQYFCAECKKPFKFLSHLATHIQVHSAEKLFGCTICKKQFTKKFNLLLHLQLHKRRKPFTCKFCKKTFARKSFMSNHMQVHLKPTVYYFNPWSAQKVASENQVTFTTTNI